MKNKKVFIIHNNTPRRFAVEAIQKLPVAEKPWRVLIEEHSDTRSLAQNRLNFLWCNIIRMWLWDSGIGFTDTVTGEVIRPYSSEEIHWWHKTQWLEKRVVEINGKMAEGYVSRDLSVKEFAILLNKIEMYWAGEGLILPRPEDIYYRAMGLAA